MKAWLHPVLGAASTSAGLGHWQELGLGHEKQARLDHYTVWQHAQRSAHVCNYFPFSSPPLCHETSSNCIPALCMVYPVFQRVPVWTPSLAHRFNRIDLEVLSVIAQQAIGGTSSRVPVSSSWPSARLPASRRPSA